MHLLFHSWPFRQVTNGRPEAMHAPLTLDTLPRDVSHVLHGHLDVPSLALLRLVSRGTRSWVDRGGFPLCADFDAFEQEVRR